MARRRARRAERGTVIVEWALTLPLLLLLFIGLLDSAQMVLLHAQLDNLTREAGNLVSRGVTVTEAWSTLALEEAPLDLQGNAQFVFTTIGRKSSTDDTPWVISQTTLGNKTYFSSIVGVPGAAATIPGITSVAPGVNMLAVESAYGFNPTIAPPAFTGLSFPPFVQGIAYF